VVGKPRRCAGRVSRSPRPPGTWPSQPLSRPLLIGVGSHVESHACFRSATRAEVATSAGMRSTPGRRRRRARLRLPTGTARRCTTPPSGWVRSSTVSSRREVKSAP